MPTAKSTDLVTADEDANVKKGTIELFGEKFSVLLGVNMFGLSQAMDPQNPSGMTRYMINSIASKDRQRFTSLLGRQHGFDMEALIKTFDAIVGVQSGDRPTKQSSGSSATTTKKVVTRRSVEA